MFPLPPPFSSFPLPQDEKERKSIQIWTLKEFIENFVTYERDYLTHASYYMDVDETGLLINEKAECAEPDLFWLEDYEETQKTWFSCNKCHTECDSYSDLQIHLIQYHSMEISNISDIDSGSKKNHK